MNTKKWISLLLIPALLASLAFALGGCKGESADATTSDTEASTYDFTFDFTWTDPWTETETVTEEPTTTTTTTMTTTTTSTAPTSSTTKPSTSSTTASTSTTTTSTTVPPLPETANYANVKSRLSSGSYTFNMVLTDDDNDTATKYASNGRTAFVVKIPDGNYDLTLISAGGKYYMISELLGKYAEMTQVQYNECTAMLNSYFSGALSGLALREEPVQENGYVKETYTRSGSVVRLWFQNGALKYIEENVGTDKVVRVQVSLTAGAPESAFSVPSGLTEVAYDELSARRHVIDMFLS
ncbi:MAG: hypothetical protein FWF05_08295 [Oscillospiraceae bacterium]|nr:hypothetical protein [Oscillospiraceae bacterium]